MNSDQITVAIAEADNWAMARELTVGMDGEVFFEKPSTSTRPALVSAIGLVGGTKEEPRIVDDCEGAVQEDNVLAEINIIPALSSSEFTSRITKMLGYVSSLAQSHGFRVSKAASGYMLKKYLEHPKAKEFGCDPDFNAYTMEVNPKPNSETKLRTAGGHVHVGHPFLFSDPSSVQLMVQNMDMLLGIPLSLRDPDKKRQQLYGKFGSYRPKPYPGLEYRVLSNYWMGDEELMLRVYLATVKAAELTERGINLYARMMNTAAGRTYTTYAEAGKSVPPQIRTKVMNVITSMGYMRTRSYFHV